LVCFTGKLSVSRAVAAAKAVAAGANVSNKVTRAVSPMARGAVVSPHCRNPPVYS
jgi:NAD-dependent DNA ligase